MARDYAAPTTRSGCSTTSTAQFVALWGSAVVTLPRFDAAPPVTEWGIDEVAIDLFHHAVYVTAAAAAYELLEGARVSG